MKNKKSGWTLIDLMLLLKFVIVVPLFLIGWVLNIIKVVIEVVNMTGASVSTLGEIEIIFLLRIIGIILFPLGVVLGYL